MCAAPPAAAAAASAAAAAAAGCCWCVRGALTCQDVLRNIALTTYKYVCMPTPLHAPDIALLIDTAQARPIY